MLFTVISPLIEVFPHPSQNFFQASKYIPEICVIRAVQKIAWASGCGTIQLVFSSNEEISKIYEKVPTCAAAYRSIISPLIDVCFYFGLSLRRLECADTLLWGGVCLFVLTQVFVVSVSSSLIQGWCFMFGLYSHRSVCVLACQIKFYLSHTHG